MALNAFARAFLSVPDPIAFRIFGLEIRWYAICIVVGMIGAVLIMMKRTPLYGISPADKVLDFVLWVIPVGVVGARLYYCLFEWDRYKGDPISILYIHQGGLAIHGGLIFGIITAIILVRRWKQSPLAWLDLAAPGIAIGQAIGRWGNYFNSEAHGTETTLPWAIEVNGQMVHPTFLYESIWCLLLCIGLCIFEKKRKKRFNGQIILLYAIFYSIERFFVEGLRTDSLWIGSLRQAQVISVCIVICCGAGYFFLKKRSEKKAEEAAKAAEAEAPEAAEEKTAEENIEAPAETAESATEAEE